MVDKQIRIDLTATDDASDKIDAVADAADELESASPEITVTADTSSAAGDLEDVEGRADTLDGLSPELTVTADTSSADGSLEDVEGRADDLGRLTPEIEVTADTSSAESDLKDVAETAETLSKEDLEIVLKAKVSDAKGALKSLRDDMDQTADKAQTTERAVEDVGSRGGDLPAGNAIADLAGPLGDAEGAASTAAGAIEGFTDIAGGIAGKLGASEAAVAGLNTALGGIGLGLAAVAAAYTYFKGEADKAKQKQEELTQATRDYNDALAEGDYRAAGEQLAEMYEGAFDAAEKANVPTKEFLDYLKGARDDLPSFDKGMKAAKGAIEGTGTAFDKLTDRHFDQTWKSYRDEIDNARTSIKDTNGIILTQDRRVKDVARALRTAEDDTDDLTKSQEDLRRETERLERQMDDLQGALDFSKVMQDFKEDFRDAFQKVRDGRKLTADDIITLKENILDVAEYAKLTPAEVRALLRKIDRGDIQGVRDAVQTYMDNHTVQTPAGIKLLPNAATDARNDAQNQMDQQDPVRIPTQYATPAPGGTGSPGGIPQPQSLPPTEVVNVTMHLPRGYREADVIAAGRRAARRSGGLYRRVHR